MLRSVVHTAVLYLVLVVLVRLMGKRQVGQMEPAEFVVTMLVANLAAIPMEEPDMPLWVGLVPMAVVLGGELLLALLSLKSIRLRQLLCGKPVILVENGNILRRNLRRTRITLDELSGLLRRSAVLDPRTVQYAILETDGSLSVFPYPQHQPASAADAAIRVKEQWLPITLVSDGRLLKNNLPLTGKDEAWVHRELRKRGATLETTWLLAAGKEGRVIFYPLVP